MSIVKSRPVVGDSIKTVAVAVCWIFSFASSVHVTLRFNHRLPPSTRVYQYEQRANDTEIISVSVSVSVYEELLFFLSLPHVTATCTADCSDVCFCHSHLCSAIFCRVVVVDNLDNSSEESLRRVARLAGDGPPNLLFHKVPYLLSL